MSQTIAEHLARLDTAALRPQVRRALTDPSSEILDWHFEPLYGGFGQGADDSHRLYRFAGSAQTTGGVHPWAMVLKVLNAAQGSSEPGSWNYWKREALLFQSGLLQSLAPGLVAPDCYGVVEQSDQEVWIWMEFVNEKADTGLWPLERFAWAAEHLGRFNGLYLAGRPLPQAAWLNHGDWRARLQGGERCFADLPAWRLHPLARQVIPDEYVAPLLRIWNERQQLFDILAEAPRCFSHNDAYRRNLMLRRQADSEPEIVAIDWAFTGQSAAGEEIAKMLITSLNYLERPIADAEAMYRILLDSYLTGLQASGWRGDRMPVARAYAAASVLVLLEHLWLGLMGIHSDFPLSMVERIYGHPMDAIIKQGLGLSAFVFGIADKLLGPG